MNPYAIPPLIAGIIVLGLGIFVIINHKRLLNFLWFSLCANCAIWLFCYSILYTIKSTEILNIVARITYIGVTGILISSILFVRSALKLTISRLLVIFITIVYAITLYFLFKSDFILSGYWNYYFGHYPKIGKFHNIYLISWIALWIWYTLIYLYKGYRGSFGEYSVDEINRLKYLIYAFVVASLGPLDFIQKYGIELYPFGYFVSPLICTVITYAIVKHHLMDINIVFKKGLIYSFLIAIITAVYLLFVISIGKICQNLVGYQSYIVNLIAVFIIAILFNPLRNKIQTFLDKRFFKGTLETLAQEKVLFQQEIQKQDQLRAIANFASGLAHEIKNPLTAFKTFGEYLPKKHNDPEFIAKFSTIINKEVDRIDNLVHQLLDFAKPTKPNLKPLDIQQLLDETVGFLSNEFDKHKVKVVKEYHLPNDSRVNGDSTQLKQVFLNLFLNAIDAMSEGGILTLTTTCQETEKTNLSSDFCSLSSDNNLRSSVDFQSALICVKDTGKGISKENLDNLFKSFFTTKEKGTGLGLSIVQNIINDHNGTISVESKPNEGANFIIELPITNTNCNESKSDDHE